MTETCGQCHKGIEEKFRKSIHFPGVGTATEGHAHHEGEGGGHGHKLDFLVNATNTLQRLLERGTVSDSTAVSVQLVAVPAGETLEKPDDVLQLEEIELIVSPVLIRTR